MTSLPPSESWMPIPGTHGRYEASDRGRIRSHVGRSVRIIKPYPKTRLGHLMFGAHVDGVRRPISVHRAVLAAFIGPRESNVQARHLNGDPTDNRLTNLAYGTATDNERDKVRHGTHPNAIKTHCPAGHEYSPQNTYWNPGPKTNRICRTCRRMQGAQRRIRLRALKKLEDAA